MTTEGIPDGWELVRVGRPRPNVDWVVKYDGTPYMPNSDFQNKNYAIIRKIEKPKQYRPFANAAEFEPYFDRSLRPGALRDVAMRVLKYNETGIFVITGHGLGFVRYEDAFYGFKFTDGTPFGIEVAE